MDSDKTQPVSEDLEVQASEGSSHDEQARTQPLPMEDPYQEYLTKLYRRVESEINSLLVSTGKAYRESRSTKPVMKRTFSDPDGILPDFQSGFEKHGKQVMLLAEEGAGKTLTLLTFLRDAVLARIQDPAQPLPIMAQIRRWNPNKTSRLEYWLAAQSELSPGSIGELIATGEALLILDGLDELARRHMKFSKSDESYIDPRKLFLQILPANCQIVVSSNPHDYEKPGSSIPLNATIRLHPLSDGQIQEYLDFAPETEALWQIIVDDVTLLEISRIPFLLSMLALAYSNKESKLRELTGKTDGEMRDAIFEAYITRRYQQQSKHYKEELPFPLQQVFSILGLVAKRGVVRYGTGQAVMVQINEPYWDDLLIIDELRFGFMGDDSPYGGEFLAFTEKLRLIKRPKGGIGSSTFVHTMARDLLVMRQCLPVADKIDSYTVESLARVNDNRKYDIFVEILSGQFAPNYKLQAFVVLDADNSLLALTTLIKLSDILIDDEYFTPRIRLSIESRLDTLLESVLKQIMAEIDSAHYQQYIQELLSQRD